MRDRQVDAASRSVLLAGWLTWGSRGAFIQNVISNDRVDLDATQEATLCLEHAEEEQSKRGCDCSVDSSLDVGEHSDEDTSEENDKLRR